MDYVIKMVFSDGYWWSSYQDHVNEDMWWFLGKNECDASLLSRIRHDVKMSKGKIVSVIYDSEEV